MRKEAVACVNDAQPHDLVMHTTETDSQSCAPTPCSHCQVAFQPGYKAGMVAVDDFGERRLGKYSDLRNNPTLDYVSNLSPWFHFGQVGRRVALEWSLIVVTGVR